MRTCRIRRERGKTPIAYVVRPPFFFFFFLRNRIDGNGKQLTLLQSGVRAPVEPDVQFHLSLACTLPFGRFS